MAAPQNVLPWVLGGALGLAGVLQGLHWKNTAGATDLNGLENQLRIALEENEHLKRENESLRSLAQGGGAVAVPQEWIDRVESEFELRFLSSPVVHRIASEELRDRIAASIESRLGPAGIDYRQEAYGWIGWLGPQDRLLGQLTAVRALGARGWFDEVSGESWVTERFDLENIPDQAALLRLLSRILLHQHFPPPPGHPGDDAARAREALHQGAASGAEARFYAANARSIGFMPMAENFEAEQLMASLGPFMQGVTTFPLVEGKGWADTLHVQGAERLHEVLRNPPQTTREVLRPDLPRISAAPPEVPEGDGEPFLVESAGQLGLRLWLEPLGDYAAAMEVSAAWRGDRYALLPDGESGSALVWDIDLADEAAADALEALGGDLLAAMAGRDEPLGAGESVATPEGRHLRLERSGALRLRFVNSQRAGYP